LESNTNKKVILDSFISPAVSPDLEVGVWYSGYVDVLLATSYISYGGRNVWPYYAVESAKMFSKPSYIYREE
jgi:hypothetical protein